MNRLHQSDGLSILVRYTSVAAIALTASALPLKNAANEQARDDQVKVEASEDVGPMPAIVRTRIIEV